MKITRKKSKSDSSRVDLQKAIHFHQNNNLQQAKRVYKKILQKHPSNPEALHFLGTLYSQLGKFDLAIKHLQKAVKAEPKKPALLFNLAHAYHDSHDFEQTVLIYNKYLKFFPNDGEAIYQKGKALQNNKEMKQAINCYQETLQISPNRVDVLNSLGFANYEANKFDKAIYYYQKALQINPKDHIVLKNMGMVFVEKGMHTEAVKYYKNALNSNPSKAQAYNDLGFALSEMNNLEEALSFYQKSLSYDPEYAETHVNIGSTKWKLNNPDEAITSFKKALKFNPELAEAYCNMGVVLVEQGHFSEGMKCYQKAISIKPDYAQAHFGVSTLTKYTSDDEHLAEMIKICGQDFISDKQKMNLSFGIGKALEDCKEYEKGIHFLNEGNRIKRRTFDYSIEESRVEFSKLKETFNKTFISDNTISESEESGPTPIFILGMPRSGTSLVEQILASHHEVHGSGELEYMRNIIFRTTETECLEDAVSSLEKNMKTYIQSITSDYYNKLKCHNSSAKYISDKMPHNFLFIGLIALAMPHAKIVHCLRDPYDNCFSIYKLFFNGVHKYAYDLKELGQYYLYYRDLMEHWNNVLPGRIYEIHYENLVDNQEEETRKLIKACDLPWDEACLSFYNNKRRVATASSTQVRKPIYKSSVKLWENYKDHLLPLTELLTQIN